MGHTNYEISDFRPNSAKENGRQSAILDLIHLKISKLILSVIVYKFPIHYVHKLWSWVTQIMKVLIFGQIQQRKMAASRPSWILSISNFAHWYIQWLFTSFLFIMYINYDHGSHKLWVLIFGQIQQRKMAASWPSWIWFISNFAHWYIQWLPTSFLFIMHINYGHRSHKLWMFWFSAKFNQVNQI